MQAIIALALVASQAQATIAGLQPVVQSSQSSSHAECVSIASTAACAPWTGNLYINTTTLAAKYNLPGLTAASWEAALTAYNPSADLGCVADQAATVSHLTTYLCLRDVFYYSADCNVANNSPTPAAVLCASTCQTLGTSFDALLASAACPAVAPASAAFGARAAALGAAANCAATVAAWQKDAAAGAAAECVAAVAADFSVLASGSANKANKADKADAAEPDEGLSTAAKVGIAVGVVLFVALVAAAWIVYSNRHNIFPQNHPVMKYLGDGGRKSFVKPRSPLAQFRNSVSNTTTTTTVEKTYVRIVDEETGAAGADELSLKVGDTILVLQTHDDGWGFGRLTKTGAEGAFPLVCVGLE
ncbi:hypothetical protein BDR26DRAFT_513989 [Obelidium mucronatum]|nr:hypothetical protein BDR26DRAFT_513989 [Obelidium mucronatum]